MNTVLEMLDDAITFIELGCRPLPEHHTCGGPDSCCDDLCVANYYDTRLIAKMKAYRAKVAHGVLFCGRCGTGMMECMDLGRFYYTCPSLDCVMYKVEV